MRLRPVAMRLVAAIAVALSGTALTVGAAAAQPYCDPGWQFTHIERHAPRMRSLIPTLSYRNDTGNRQSFEETQYVSGTVGFTASGKIGGGVNFIVVHEEAELNLSLSASITVGFSITGHMTVDPHRTGHLAFGVWRATITGHNYYLRSNCTVGTDYGIVTTHTPWRVGYRAWETTN